MDKCGTCKHYTGAGDWDLCCNKSVRRLTYGYDDACEQYESNPIKHRYWVVMDGQVIATHFDTVGIHPVYAISMMVEDLSERMEKADKDKWIDALKEAIKEGDSNAVN